MSALDRNSTHAMHTPSRQRCVRFADCCRQ